ncbi:MAG: hypothetical protein WD431_18720 [Cyclobacteriaceae bacterium]
MSIIKTLWLIFPFWLIYSQEETAFKDPLFLSLDLALEEEYESVNVSDFLHDQLIAPINLQLKTHKNQARYYESQIRTSVCDDEICEIMHIRLLWDLVGNYVGYDTIPGHPLTKYDHVPFTSEDYIKLHELLMNKGSILKFKEKEELIDKQQVKASDVVDGTTGATALEIKEEVVDGALYTSFTLWHLAHLGDIKNLLVAHTDTLYNEALKKNFLASDRDEYELFALRRFEKADFEDNLAFVFKSLEKGTPLLKKFIFKDMPDDLWKEEAVQYRICQMFSEMDINSRTILLDKLDNFGNISSGSLEALSQYLNQMSKNQLLVFLEVLGKNEMDDEILHNMKLAQNDPTFKYAYIIQEFTDD